MREEREGCGIPDQVRNEENESGMRGIGGISLYSLGLEGSNQFVKILVDRHGSGHYAFCRRG